MIGVIGKNFKESAVDEHVLDSLIASNKIVAFHRSSQWVVIGRDAVREQHVFYTGEERRRTIFGNNFCMK